MLLIVSSTFSMNQLVTPAVRSFFTAGSVCFPTRATAKMRKEQLLPTRVVFTKYTAMFLFCTESGIKHTGGCCYRKIINNGVDSGALATTPVFHIFQYPTAVCNFLFPNEQLAVMLNGV